MALAFTSWRPSRSRSQVTQHVPHRSLDARWGDQTISAPNNGCWNQQPSPNISSTVSPIDPASWGSPTSTLVNSSPEVGSNGSCVPQRQSVDVARDAITIKIPLPWYRKSIRRARSLPRSTQSPVDERQQIPPLHVIENNKQSLTSPSWIQSCGCNHNNHTGQTKETWHKEASTIPTHIAHQSVLHVLSPVREDFGPKTPTRTNTTSPAVTPIETSPSDSIRSFTNPYQSLHVSLSRPLPNTTKPLEANKYRGQNLRTKSTSRNRSRRRQTERGLGLEHTSYMRSPSVDGIMKQYGFENVVPTKEPAIDNAAVNKTRERHSPVLNTRRLSADSVSSTSSTDVASDSEYEVDEKEFDIYQTARQASKDANKNSSKAFYAHIVNDYKKIARDIEADTNQKLDNVHRKSYTGQTHRSPQMLPPWAIDSPINHILVPEDEELWG